MQVGDGEIVDGGVPAGLLDGRADGVRGPGVDDEPVSSGEVAGVLPAVAAVEGPGWPSRSGSAVMVTRSPIWTSSMSRLVPSAVTTWVSAAKELRHARAVYLMVRAAR